MLTRSFFFCCSCGSHHLYASREARASDYRPLAMPGCSTLPRRGDDTLVLVRSLPRLGPEGGGKVGARYLLRLGTGHQDNNAARRRSAGSRIRQCTIIRREPARIDCYRLVQ